MSLNIWRTVWEKSRHGKTALLVLLAIADHANANGEAYPSVDSLAKKCGMKRRNLQITLSKLEQSGELSIKRNGGPYPKFPNLYCINLQALQVQAVARVQSDAQVQINANRGAILCIKGVHPTAPKSLITNSNRFTEFWNTYPDCKRKGSKTKCERVWQKENLDAIADQIIAHVQAMTASNDWEKNSGAFIPAPLTYLNTQRWDGAVVTNLSSSVSRFGVAI
jgi:hypothetical protein